MLTWRGARCNCLLQGPHSQLGDLHHGQAVRKAVFGRVFSFKEDLNNTAHEACVAKVDEPSQADGGVLGKTKAARMSSQ